MQPQLVEALFEQYHDQLFRFLVRACGDYAQAEDLTQEVFVRVAGGSERYEERGQARAWLFKIARHLLADRRKRKRPEASSIPLESVVPRRLEPSEDEANDLRRALGTLPTADREVFLLSQVGGLSYAEVAQVTGASVAAVRSRIFRARSTLRSVLDSGPSVARHEGVGR